MGQAHSGKSRQSVIGLMSSTSCDGIDAAVLITDGQAHLEPGPARAFP